MAARERKPRWYWEELVEKFRGEGCTQEAFARRHGVRVKTFRSWLYKLGKEQRALESSVEFVEVVQNETVWAEEAKNSVKRLRLYGGDVVLESGEWPPASYVAELAHALRSLR